MYCRLYFYAVEAEAGSRHIQCGSTIINDKFIVFAAHCNVLFSAENKAQLKAVVIRDGTIYQEFIGLRRVFNHPWFSYPSLYNDIAVGELNRRIVYDYDKYGDSPA